MWTVVNILEGSEKENGVCGVVAGGWQEEMKKRAICSDLRLGSEWLIELAIESRWCLGHKKKKKS